MIGPYLTKHNDTWYKIIREIPHHNFIDKNDNLNMDILKAWRDYLGGDHVLKTPTHFQICETVQDIECEPIVYTEAG